METLRSEIIETEKARSDFLKWKLITSAALGSVSIGIISTNNERSNIQDLAIFFIPFACAYIDLLCYHLNLRIFVISHFFRKIIKYNNILKNDLQQNFLGEKNRDLLNILCVYEETCANVRFVYEIENWALKWSSIFLSLIVIATVYYAHDKSDAYLYLTAGILGILMAWLTETVYSSKSNELNEKLKLGDEENINMPDNLEKLIKILKTINLLFSFLLFVFGTFLIIEYIIHGNYNEDYRNRDYAKGLLLVLPGILCLLMATLIEHTYKRTIKLEKDIFIQKHQPPSSSFREWIFFFLYSAFVPLIGFYLRSQDKILYKLYKEIDDKFLDLLNLVKYLAAFLIHIGIILPIILLFITWLSFYLETKKQKAITIIITPPD